MKPLHIALLLAAGAAGGALVMTVAQHQPVWPAASSAVQSADAQKAVPAGAQAISQPQPTSEPQPTSQPTPSVAVEPPSPRTSPVVKAEVAKVPPRPSPWEAPKPGRVVHPTWNSNPPRVVASIPPVVRSTPPPVAAVPPAAATEPATKPLTEAPP